MDEQADGLREALANWLQQNLFWGLDPSKKLNAADALLAGPLAPLLDRLRAVEELADELNATSTTGNDGLRLGRLADRLRRALDGEA